MISSLGVRSRSSSMPALMRFLGGSSGASGPFLAGLPGVCCPTSKLVTTSTPAGLEVAALPGGDPSAPAQLAAAGTAGPGGPAARTEHISSMRTTRSLSSAWLCRMPCLKDAKSKAFTDVPGRRRTMQSMSFLKVRFGVVPSSSGLKSSSTYMSNCFSLTSSSWSAFMTCGSLFILENSSRLMEPLLSLSIWLKMVLMASRTPSSTMREFSPSAVLPTTSTRMPTSMFIMVKEFSRM
mmetsp:Transcript_68772/g.212668  ORF Transcript_68772/g.212668 Transcript_68772/m.212668 type:complete len:237 (-) Transcript_68772:1077-1787(-)